MAGYSEVKAISAEVRGRFLATIAVIRAWASVCCSGLMNRRSPSTTAVFAMTLVLPSAVPRLDSASWVTSVPPRMRLGLRLRPGMVPSSWRKASRIRAAS